MAKRLLVHLARGAAAGAAGTTALNALTYLDMAVRGRPGSSTPQQTVERIAGAAGVAIPGDGEEYQHRLEGLGALLGLVAGVGSGAALGLLAATGPRPAPATSVLLATGVAMLAGNLPMTALGVTDPRRWPASAWLADLGPHVGYGVVTAATLRALERRRARWPGRVR